EPEPRAVGDDALVRGLAEPHGELAGTLLLVLPGGGEGAAGEEVGDRLLERRSRRPDLGPCGDRAVEQVALRARTHRGERERGEQRAGEGERAESCEWHASSGVWGAECAFRQLLPSRGRTGSGRRREG